MSKIAFFGVPAHGHVNPTLPVVRELVRRGEQVFYYNNPPFQPQIEAAGARFVPYPGTELNAARITALLEDGNLASITVLMLRVTQSLLPFALDELKGLKPDLIVFDALSVWGKMAASILEYKAAASVPIFVLGDDQMELRDIPRMLRTALPSVPGIIQARARLVRQFGKTVFPPMGPLFPMRAGLNLVYTVRELNPPSPILDDTFRFVGPSIDASSQDRALPLEIGKDEMLVYISLGTVHTGKEAFYRTCFEAFEDVPAKFLLSTGRGTALEDLAPIPANFSVHESVSQLAVLARAGLFITHGGMNSLHEALYYGVPMVLAPQQFEQLFNARLAARLGAGILVGSTFARQIGAHALRRAFEEVRGTPEFRVNAQRLGQTLRAAGGFRLAADEIQAYLGR